MEDRLIKKLEEIKIQGNYAIEIRYGGDIGCDDGDVEAMERKVRVIYAPIGYLGGCRKMWKGKLKDFLKFNVYSIPAIISNPPKKEEYENSGFYIWGTEEAINLFKKKEMKNEVNKTTD